MSLLQKIKTGLVGRPQRVVVYAPEGLGKTTIASQFPDPLFFDLEAGTHHTNVRRIEPTSLVEIEDTLREIAKGTPAKLGFRTVVIDTFDRLEQLAGDAVCEAHKKSGIEDFGYGKGYVYLADRITEVLALLDGVMNAGFNVVLLAHSEVKKFEQPDAAGAYDRYQLKLEKKTEPLIKEWADALLFGNWKTQVAEKGNEDNPKYKGVGGKLRVLYCNHTAAFDAKNRWGLADQEPWDIATIKKGFAAIGAPWDASEQPTAAKAEPKAPVEKTEPKAEPVAEGSMKPAETPEDDQIPGIADPEVENFKNVCAPHAAAVDAFLLKKGEIKEGQTYLDVSADYRAKVLRRPAEFLKVVLAGALKAA